MANSQNCIGCRACEVACSMAHNDEQHVLTPPRFQPRITVVKNSHQRTAVTCHHCNNAPCKRSRPNGAISQVNDAIQVAEEKCIGCKACVVACPFGTIQVTVSPPQNGQEKPVRRNAIFAAIARGPGLRAELPGRRADVD